MTVVLKLQNYWSFVKIIIKKTLHILKNPHTYKEYHGGFKKRIIFDIKCIDLTFFLYPPLSNLA